MTTFETRRALHLRLAQERLPRKRWVLESLPAEEILAVRAAREAQVLAPRPALTKSRMASSTSAA